MSDRHTIDARLRLAAEQAMARSVPPPLATEIVSTMPAHTWQLDDLELAVDASEEPRAMRDSILEWALHLKIQVVMLQCELFNWRDRKKLHEVVGLTADAPDWCSLDDLRNHQSILVGVSIAWERFAGIVYMTGLDRDPPENPGERNSAIRGMLNEQAWRWLAPYVDQVATGNRIRRNPEVHAVSPIIREWIATGQSDQFAEWQRFMPMFNELWENLLRSIGGEAGRTLSNIHMDGDEIAEEYRDQL